MLEPSDPRILEPFEEGNDEDRRKDLEIWLRC
jgi:hypothetical protein